MAIQYQSVPALKQWEKDSSVMFAVRDKDIILKRIDHILSFYERADESSRAFMHTDLYFVTDYWLKSYQRSSKMEKGRYPAVHALFVCVVNELCSQFGVTVNVLPRELELMFGRQLSEIGVRVDSVDERAKYLARNEIRKYRIWFKNGRAYQHAWWRKFFKNSIVPCSTRRAYNPKAFVKENDGTRFDNVNYAGFIMTMGREIYMMKHAPGAYGEQNGLYHSAYLAGEAVMCAGSMLIVDGRIQRIRTDSGHYKPTASNTLGFLLAMRMFGVPLEKVWVEDFEGRMAVPALQFLHCGASWKTLMLTMVQHEKDVKSTHAYMAQLRREKDGVNLPPPQMPVQPVPQVQHVQQPGPVPEFYANQQ